MKVTLTVCDICQKQIKEPAAVIKLDYRNKPRNSGGRIGEDFHGCEDCRLKMVHFQFELKDVVVSFLKSLKDRAIPEKNEVKSEPSE